MYTFPDEMKKIYESSPMSFVYYQNIGGKAVPVLASDGFCRNTGMEGYDRAYVLEWLRKGLFERMHPDDVGYMAKLSDDFLHHRSSYDVVFRCRLEGAYAWILGAGKWQTMPDGTELALISYVNVTEFKEQMIAAMGDYDILRRDTFYSDPLTGLPNINYLHEFAREKTAVLRATGKTVYAVYTDIYSMLSYNNQYGFREGDELLKLTAETLKEKFPDDLVVRGANDHFLIVTAPESTVDLTARLEEANDDIRKKATGNTMGIRSGICEISGDMEVVDALDRAKKVIREINDDMNRSCAFYSQDLNDRYWKNRYIIENFNRALEKGWFKVYYQGIISTDSEKASAFEALAKWIDPVRGTITPAEFIPVLRRYHQLYKLDLYMFEQVCREVEVRYENGIPLVPVSVNFSRQDFDHADIPSALDVLYEKYGIGKYAGKNYFIIEVTEQDIAVGTENFKRQLREIRDRGYLLWLDDFGSGYSAINMFSSYDFDLVKYDLELMKHLDDNNGANRLILKDLIRLAKNLGMHTLVEGVENREQVDFVQDVGCEFIQGFYYFRPEPLEEILYRMHSGQKMMQAADTGENKVLERKHLAPDK